MDNPQYSSPVISARDIYSCDTHTNFEWVIPQYKIPSLHFDQKQIVRKRQYAAQKKGLKVNDFYLTKKGFYMDDMIKRVKDLPSPNEHLKNQPWLSSKQQLSLDQVKTVRSSIKYSYLDQIQIQQKYRSRPSVGRYNLNKSMQQLDVEKQKLKQKKIEPGSKRFFYENTQYLSDAIPGMGIYNPHLSVDKLQLNKTNHKFWIDKHNQTNKFNTSRELIKPNPASYSPTNQSYNTFQRTFCLPKKNKQIKNGFGSDSRFPYTRANKKVILEERPAPWNYETKIDWKGKGNISPSKKRWADLLWKGSPPKVYN